MTAATRCVDQVADGGSRHITALDRQRHLLQPGVDSGSKLPNIGNHLHVNDEPADGVELVVKHCEAAWQGVARYTTGPRSGHRGDGIVDRVVTEDAVRRSRSGGFRAAHTIDVIGSGVVKHAASHVVYLVVRVRG